jgi:hypothetical protein
MIESVSDAIVSLSKSIDWATWVPGLATVVLVVLTFRYVRLTEGILENQTNPCVIVSVIHDDERPTILQLVIKNVGAGLAQDIRFDFSRPIPARAWGIAERDAKSVEPITSGPLIDGVPALGPGEERRIDWGQYGGLTKNLGSEPIIVECTFKKNGKAMPPTKCTLDVKSFESTATAERPSMKAATELEKISKDLHNLATGLCNLKIEMVEDRDCRPEEDKEDET